MEDEIQFNEGEKTWKKLLIMVRIIVSFSGGKDSQAALIWAVKKYGTDRVEAVFCDTGWEHPVTTKHVHDVCTQLGVKLTILRDELTNGFEGLCLRMRAFPRALRRACTSVLKVQPMIDWVLQQKDNIIIIQGIRGKESESRSKMAIECSFFSEYFISKKSLYKRKEVLEWCKIHDASVLRPIFNWEAQDVIDFILKNNQQPNELYKRGAARVGCFPCIMCRLSEIRIVAKDKTMKERLINLERKVNSLRNEGYAGFFETGKIPDWACKEKYPTAQEVFDYVCRNDAQLDMFEPKEGYSCMSLYHGLCE